MAGFETRGNLIPVQSPPVLLFRPTFGRTRLLRGLFSIMAKPVRI
jgi:hypothetical protein